MWTSRIHAMITMDDILILAGLFIVAKIIEVWIVEKIRARRLR